MTARATLSFVHTSLLRLATWFDAFATVKQAKGSDLRARSSHPASGPCIISACDIHHLSQPTVQRRPWFGHARRTQLAPPAWSQGGTWLEGSPHRPVARFPPY